MTRVIVREFVAVSRDVIGGSATPIKARLAFQVEDPLTVRAMFYVGGDEVPWLLSRDVMVDALVAAQTFRKGDVQMWPLLVGGEQVLRLHLSNRSEVGLVDLPFDPTRRFLNETLEAFPRSLGDRHADPIPFYDWDVLLAARPTDS
jgi:hypothetical protein